MKRIPNLFKDFVESEKTGGLLLIICTAISLIIANSVSGESYVQFMHSKLDLSFANINLNLSIEHWVNDGLMAIFFLMVGLEVEREIYIGELSDFRKAMLPLAAALGGMVIPALIHFAFNYGTPAAAGFAIPMATDIAFALGILSLAGRRVHPAVKVFLAALAIIDDIGAVLMIAFFYTKTILFTYLAIAFALLGIMFVFNRLRWTNLLLYIIPGIAMWYCFLQSGVHATIAGVLLAFVVPFHKHDENNISYTLQHALHKPVAFIIVPIFALVNTAIILPSDITAMLFTANSLGIIFGLFAGKLLGIFFFPFIMVKTGLSSMQAGLTWRSLAGIGLLGGIGFTMSMFIGNLAFEDAEMIIASKISILVASTLSALLGLLLFKTQAKVNGVDYKL